MYCRKCGAELKAGDKFCENCGTPVAHGEPAKGPDSKTKRNIIIAAIIALVVIGGGIAALVVSLSDGYSPECRDKLETAQQYVEDGNLTDAEAAYLDIIALEPDKPTAYIELAENVYVPQLRYTEAEGILREGQKNTGGSHKIDKSIEKVDQKRKEASEWMTAYRNLLAQNEHAINMYEKPVDEEGIPLDYLGNREGTALCDLDGDGIPELLFFTYDVNDEDNDGNYDEELQVYTFADGKALELKYRWTHITSMPELKAEIEKDEMYADQVTGPVCYVIYKEKGVNGFSIHSRYYSDDGWVTEDTTNRYSFSASKELDRTDVFSHSIQYDDETDGSETKYFSNYQECSQAQYEKQYDASVDNIETVLFWFLPSYIDEIDDGNINLKIWNSTEGKNVCISYEEMIKKLTVSDSKPAESNASNPVEYLKSVCEIGNDFASIDKKYSIRGNGGPYLDAAHKYKSSNGQYEFLFFASIPTEVDWDFKIADTDPCFAMYGTAESMLGIKKEISLDEFRRSANLDNISEGPGTGVETSEYAGMVFSVVLFSDDPTAFTVLLRDVGPNGTISPDTRVYVDPPPTDYL